jgi:DNA-binding response OmpR family regulator
MNIEAMRNTILIIDDTTSVRQTLKRALELEQYRVLLARNRPETLGLLHSQSPDLMVLDLQLGLEDGWQFFRELTKLTPRVPIIVTTGRTGQKGKAIKAGAEALVETPFNVTAFLELVEQLLAETAEAPLQRLFGDTEYCRYVPRHFDLCLTNMRERYVTPLPLQEDFLKGRRGGANGTRSLKGTPRPVAPRSKRRFLEAAR